MASEMSCEHPHPVSAPKQAQVSRFRSVPQRQPFVQSVFLSAMHYMGILAAATTLTIFLTDPNPLATKVLIVCLAFTAVTWLLAFFKRHATHCPLCKGTPLINTGAIPHQKAKRLFPFNHGVTATLSIIATQKFCCMYCGTGFDILKPPSHLRDKDQSSYRSGYSSNNTYTSDDQS